MKIFFLCRTGHHTALIAAAIHMGMIKGKKSLRETVRGIRGFDEISFRNIGTPFYVGKDKNGNDIFTIGIANESIIMERAVKELLTLMTVDPKERQVINVSRAVSGWTKLGLILKKLHLNPLARVFFYLGAEAEFNGISRIIKKVKVSAG